MGGREIRPSMVENDTRIRVDTFALLAANGEQINPNVIGLNFRIIKLRLCPSLPRFQAMLRLPALKRSVGMSGFLDKLLRLISIVRPEPR